MAEAAKAKAATEAKAAKAEAKAKEAADRAQEAADKANDPAISPEARAALQAKTLADASKAAAAAEQRKNSKQLNADFKASNAAILVVLLPRDTQSLSFRACLDITSVLLTA